MSPAPAALVHDPEVNEVRAADGASAAELSGAWDIRALEARAALMQARLRAVARSGMRWDLTRIERLDHIGALLIWQAWGKRRPTQLELAPDIEVFFDNLDAPRGIEEAPKNRDPWRLVRAMGEQLLLAAEHAAGIAQLLGQVMIDSVSLIKNPSRGPWREISASLFRIGGQALGITALVGFLIGIVLSYLSSEQLKAVGANTLIVNILGIGIIRELGPVITAVLVAGRSGSAITAQLGVMRVTEELDALSVMGIPHTVRLILPKIIALAIALPLLILWTSAIALFGGSIAASHELGISMHSFLTSLPTAVPVLNLWLGVGKGVVFGALIALTACHFGMRVQPNTESLGVGTTNSVVTSITVVIIADAFLAVVFADYGINLL
ncbi:MAG: ABC transporter permease [Betaproteobacteria bacterium]|nr:ABC transporter permease [Betaproteobacteria bacterium]